MALDAGLKIASYTRNPECYKEGIEALGPLQNKLQFFALDIETDPGIPATRTMVDGIRALGVRPSGYLYRLGHVAYYNEWRIDFMHPTPIAHGGVEYQKYNEGWGSATV